MIAPQNPDTTDGTVAVSAKGGQEGEGKETSGDARNAPPEDAKKPFVPATAEGTDDSKSTDLASQNTSATSNKQGGQEGDGKEQSQSMVRASYLPVNKLKDAPSVSQYEGKDPMQFAKGDDIGTGQIIKEKVSELKQKVTHLGKKPDRKSED